LEWFSGVLAYYNRLYTAGCLTGAPLAARSGARLWRAFEEAERSEDLLSLAWRRLAKDENDDRISTIVHAVIVVALGRITASEISCNHMERFPAPINRGRFTKSSRKPPAEKVHDFTPATTGVLADVFRCRLSDFFELPSTFCLLRSLGPRSFPQPNDRRLQGPAFQPRRRFTTGFRRGRLRLTGWRRWEFILPSGGQTWSARHSPLITRNLSCYFHPS
jgi:hypothetical protein